MAASSNAYRVQEVVHTGVYGGQGGRGPSHLGDVAQESSGHSAPADSSHVKTPGFGSKILFLKNYYGNLKIS